MGVKLQLLRFTLNYAYNLQTTQYQKLQSENYFMGFEHISEGLMSNVPFTYIVPLHFEEKLISLVEDFMKSVDDDAR